MLLLFSFGLVLSMVMDGAVKVNTRMEISYAISVAIVVALSMPWLLILQTKDK